MEVDGLWIIWTDGLPHLSGLPHLPGVPHLHVNRPLVGGIAMKSGGFICFAVVNKIRFASVLLSVELIISVMITSPKP